MWGSESLGDVTRADERAVVQVEGVGDGVAAAGRLVESVVGYKVRTGNAGGGNCQNNKEKRGSEGIQGGGGWWVCVSG